MKRAHKSLLAGCESQRAHLDTMLPIHTHTHTHTHIYIYIG